MMLSINNLQARAAETFAGMAPGGGAGMFIVGFMAGVNTGGEMWWGAWTGVGHGAAMIANAVTLHQIDSLDSYVDGLIEENGGTWSLYGAANFSGHVGVVAAALATGGIIYYGPAAAMPTFAAWFGFGAVVTGGAAATGGGAAGAGGTVTVGTGVAGGTAAATELAALEAELALLQAEIVEAEALLASGTLDLFQANLVRLAIQQSQLRIISILEALISLI